MQNINYIQMLMWVLAPMVLQVISEGETLKEELRNTAPQTTTNQPRTSET